jgi:hypothetical protein
LLFLRDHTLSQWALAVLARAALVTAATALTARFRDTQQLVVVVVVETKTRLAVVLGYMLVLAALAAAVDVTVYLAMLALPEHPAKEILAHQHPAARLRVAAVVKVLRAVLGVAVLVVLVGLASKVA